MEKPMQSLLTDFRSQLIKLLNTPSGISEIGVTAARRLAKNLDQGTPTYGNTGTINPFSDEMGFLNANSEASRSNGHELFCSFAAISNALPWYKHSEPDTPNFDNGHANAEIIGLKGVQVRDDIRVGATLMRPGLTYPDHHHLPEEVYIVLSEGLWRQNNEPWWSPGLGGYVYNPPDILHAMKSVEAPLCAIWCMNVA